MLAPDGELTSDRLVVLLLVDCKPSRSNQRSMTLKSGLTENAPYKCNICFAKLLSRFVSVTRGGYDAGVKSRREKLSQQADQERQRARDWLVRFMQDNQPKFYTKEELRVVASKFQSSLSTWGGLWRLRTLVGTIGTPHYGDGHASLGVEPLVFGVRPRRRALVNQTHSVIPAAHNGLVGGSSPPGPTTHSFEP